MLDIHIHGKRVAMTERMMEEVLINEIVGATCNVKIPWDCFMASHKCKNCICACGECKSKCILYTLIQSHNYTYRQTSSR